MQDGFFWGGGAYVWDKNTSAVCVFGRILCHRNEYKSLKLPMSVTESSSGSGGFGASGGSRSVTISQPLITPEHFLGAGAFSKWIEHLKQ